MQDTYILLSQVGFRRILGGSLEGTHAKKQTHKSVNDIDVTTPTRYHWAKNHNHNGNGHKLAHKFIVK